MSINNLLVPNNYCPIYFKCAAGDVEFHDNVTIDGNLTVEGQIIHNNITHQKKPDAVYFDPATKTFSYYDATKINLVGTGAHAFVSGGYGETLDYRGIKSSDNSLTITAGLTDIDLVVPAADTIYSADGSLASNRIVNMNNNSLAFHPNTNGAFYVNDNDGLPPNTGKVGLIIDQNNFFGSGSAGVGNLLTLAGNRTIRNVIGDYSGSGPQIFIGDYNNIAGTIYTDRLEILNGVTTLSANQNGGGGFNNEIVCNRNTNSITMNTPALYLTQVPSTDNTQNNILVRDSVDGEVVLRTASSILLDTGFSEFLTANINPPLSGNIKLPDGTTYTVVNGGYDNGSFVDNTTGTINVPTGLYLVQAMLNYSSSTASPATPDDTQIVFRDATNARDLLIGLKTFHNDKKETNTLCSVLSLTTGVNYEFRFRSTLAVGTRIVYRDSNFSVKRLN